MIFKMAGGCAEIGARLAGFVEAAFAETGVGALVVGGEIEIVLNKKSAGVSVISDAVAADGLERGRVTRKSSTSRRSEKVRGRILRNRLELFSTNGLFTKLN